MRFYGFSRDGGESEVRCRVEFWIMPHVITIRFLLMPKILVFLLLLLEKRIMILLFLPKLKVWCSFSLILAVPNCMEIFKRMEGHMHFKVFLKSCSFSNTFFLSFLVSILIQNHLKLPILHAIICWNWYIYTHTHKMKLSMF